MKRETFDPAELSAQLVEMLMRYGLRHTLTALADACDTIGVQKVHNYPKDMDSPAPWLNTCNSILRITQRMPWGV